MHLFIFILAYYASNIAVSKPLLRNLVIIHRNTFRCRGKDADTPSFTIETLHTPNQKEASCLLNLASNFLNIFLVLIEKLVLLNMEPQSNKFALKFEAFKYN